MEAIMAVREKRNVDALLAESFKELVKRRPADKITIKEITDGAGVIRPTFYNHFKDKYELLEWIIKDELLAPVKPLIASRMIKEALVFLFRNIEQEKNFYSQIVKLEGQNSFESIILNSLMEILLEIIPEDTVRAMPKYEWLTAERVAAFYAQNMCYVAITWIKSGYQVSGRELADIYEYMMKSSMDEMFYGTMH